MRVQVELDRLWGTLDKNIRVALGKKGGPDNHPVFQRYNEVLAQFNTLEMPQAASISAASDIRPLPPAQVSPSEGIDAGTPHEPHEPKQPENGVLSPDSSSENARSVSSVILQIYPSFLDGSLLRRYQQTYRRSLVRAWHIMQLNAHLEETMNILQ